MVARDCQCSALVFVYKLRPPLADQAVWWDAAHGVFEPYANVSSNAFPIARTGMYALNQILQHRLEHSCCRTTDPEKADLFFAPMATMVYNQAGYRRLCQTHTASEVARQLVHMRTPTKACRHFFSVPHPRAMQST